MKQKLILLALVVALTIVSQSSLSLGMGKIQVYSALGEPLLSSIEILTNADEELGDLTVSLASAEDYQKVGLDRSFVPANIMVSMDEINPHQINVTSNGPVTEPIVSLLLDVNWNNGRILREFTVLLDPPVYDAASTQAQVNNVVIESVQDNVVEAPADTTEDSTYDRPADSNETQVYTNEDVEPYLDDSEAADDVTMDEPAASDTTSYASAGNEVYVNAGDTLWRIANNNRVGDLSTHQMMMAIYNNNPNAFIDNNINQMIKGSTLTMPTVDEARSISLSEALAQVESHHNSWSPGTQDYSSFQTETEVDDSSDDSSSSLDYGVQLSGNDNDGSDVGQSNADEGTDSSAQAIEEDLYNREAENAELQERVSELENIVEQQQEVMEIQDDSMANLSDQLGSADDQTTDDMTADDMTVDDDVDDSMTAADDTTTTDDIWDTMEDGSETVDDETLNLTLDATDAAADDMTDESTADDSQTDSGAAMTDADADDSEGESTPVQTTPTKFQGGEETSMVDTAINWVMDNLKWVLAGLVGLIVLLFLPRMLRKDDSDAEETSFLDDIKARKREEAAAEEAMVDSDDAETKMNKPLDLDDDGDSDEDDVLAELDKSIVFDEDSHDDVDDELTEAEADEDDNEQDSEDQDDGFDLDGFLSDDSDDDISVTADHSETMAGVDFGDDDDDDDEDDGHVTKDHSKTLADADLDSESDDDFGDFDLDLDDEIEAVEDAEAAAEEAADNLEDAKEALEDVADETAEKVADASKGDDDDFSFDEDFDEQFDFDLDEELEELEKDDNGSTDTSESAADEFNDVLDISEEDADQFETTEEEDTMEEEIDLGLEDLLEDADAIDTKLDLAKAYMEMGDEEGARNLLKEIVNEGSDEQVEAAKKLMDDM